jgi:hypothetical protein
MVGNTDLGKEEAELGKGNWEDVARGAPALNSYFRRPSQIILHITFA